MNPYDNPFTTENCNRSRNLPYGIHVSPHGKGFSFDLDQLPGTLQALLGIYCNVVI